MGEAVEDEEVGDKETEGARGVIGGYERWQRIERRAGPAGG